MQIVVHGVNKMVTFLYTTGNFGQNCEYTTKRFSLITIKILWNETRAFGGIGSYRPTISHVVAYF